MISNGACSPDKACEDIKAPMTPIEGALKRINNGLGDLNDFIGQLEEKISPALSSSRPEESEKCGSPRDGESGVFNELESVSTRIMMLCDRVRDIRDRVEL